MRKSTLTTTKPTDRKRSRAAKAQTIERRAIRALKYGTGR